MSRRMRVTLVCALLGGFILLGSIIAFRAFQRPPLRERFQTIKVGMPEAEVREILGNPSTEGRNIRADELILSYKEGNTYFIVAIQDGHVTKFDSGES